jgi:hypothetical protein
VIAKLQEIAQSVGTLRVAGVSEGRTSAPTRLQETGATFPYTFKREDFQHLNDEEYAAYTQTQRQLWERDQKMRGEIAMESLAPPSLPTGYGSGVERVPLHAKNSLGDTCIAVDAESGCCTYQCSKCGDSYVANNPAVRGCQCGGSGERRQASAEDDDVAITPVRTDDGAIEGTDSRW